MIKQTFAIYEARCDGCGELLGVESTTSAREPVEQLKGQAYRAGYAFVEWRGAGDYIGIDAEKAFLYCSRCVAEGKIEVHYGGSISTGEGVANKAGGVTQPGGVAKKT